MFTDLFSKGHRKVTIYKTHDKRERDLYASRLKNAGIWCQTRDSEMARNTASFGSNFIDIQHFAGDKTKDSNFYAIDVHAEDADKAKKLLGDRCRVIDTQLI
ncbi:hypothetical protein ACTNEN_04610 [Oribacterium sp. HCP28S3_H8]|uniref:hypothetical protein n=1 Tax=Oribacterium sp. HCP28S3_H8 TaxID=3438945 RepID=UPI003F899E17